MICCLRALGDLERATRVIGTASEADTAPPHAAGERLGLRAKRCQEDGVPILAPQHLDAFVAHRSHHLHPDAVAREKVAAKRHERDGAVGELAEHRHALHVTGDRLDRRDRGCDLQQADELLTREPTDLIELVHAHVDGDPAARAAELGTRRVGIPLPARDECDLTQLSREDAPPQLHELRHEPSPVADLQQYPRVLAGSTRGRDLPVECHTATQDRRCISAHVATSSRCNVDGAAISTASMPPSATALSRSRCVRTPGLIDSARASAVADVSTTATTRTDCDPASARRCVQPMRPAPITAMFNGSAMVTWNAP